MNEYDLHPDCPPDAAKAIAKWLRRCGNVGILAEHTKTIHTDADAEDFDVVCWHISSKTPEAWAKYLAEPEELNHPLK